MAETFQERKQFQEEHREILGGSEIKDVLYLQHGCGLRLLRKKVGEKADAPFWGNQNTDRGTAYEPFAAKIYSEKTGRELRKVNTRRSHKKYPFMQPLPDYQIINNARGPEWGPGLLSIKCPRDMVYRQLKYAMQCYCGVEPQNDFEKALFEKGRETLLPYICQLQYELEVFGYKWGGFCFFWADGFEISHADFDYDAEMAQMIVEAAVKFREVWEAVLSGDLNINVAQKRLDPTSSTCRRCEYVVTCHFDELQKLLAKESDGIASIPVIPGLDPLVSQLREYEEIKDGAEALVDGVKDKIREMLADCDAAEGMNVRAYNRLQKGRQSLQKEPLLKFLGEHSKSAQKIVDMADSGKLELSPDLRLFLGQIADFRKTVEESFITTGRPFRTLRIYDLAKKG